MKLGKAQKRILIAFALLVGIQAVFVACNLCAASLPREAMASHIEQSQDDPVLTRGYDYSYKLAGSRVSYDNNRYLTSVALQHEQGSVFDTAMTTVIEDTHEDGTKFVWPYFRYWHGWQLLTDVCFMIGPIQVVEVVAGFLALGSLILLTVGMRRYLGWIPSLAFVAVAFFSTNIFCNFVGDILLSLSVSTVTFCSAAILLLGRARSDRRLFYISLACLLTGAVYCFIDFLTIPAFALALVVLCALLASDAIHLSGWGFCQRFLAFTLLFVGGFAFTWCAKWLLAVIPLGLDYVLANVTGEVSLWTGPSASEEVTAAQTMLVALKEKLWPIVLSARVLVGDNPAGILGVAVTVLSVLGAGIACVRAKLGKKSLAEVFPASLFLIVPAAFVLLYLFIMGAHAIWHMNIFGYKSWSIVLGLIACASLYLIGRLREPGAARSLRG